MSPDTLSTLFPDRPIRPLPKRKIREKLSPEAVESIEYPPQAKYTVPLFIYPPYTKKDEESLANRRNKPDEAFSAETSLQYGKEKNVAASFDITHGPTYSIKPLNGHTQSPASEKLSSVERKPSISATSSADGYDSLENANNKKKRKIPSAGDSLLTSVTTVGGNIGDRLSAELPYAISNINGGKNWPIHPSDSASDAQNSNAQGISGSGRGRLSRTSKGRSPLRALPDGNNSWLARTKTSAQWTSKDYEASGIISNAIANAEKSPALGQENTASLLQQQSKTTKPALAASQFTFSCESQVPGSIQWPGPLPHGSLETTRMEPASRDTGRNSDSPNQGKQTTGTRHDVRQQNRQRLERELSMAARHRRQIASESYHHNKPKPEDIWICEFCEYERIFGSPPRALIRNYEIKDRRRRQEEADRKRLLEKAKSKNRKAKKGSKGIKGASGSSAVADKGVTESIGDENAETEHCHSTQSEYEYEDDFEEDASKFGPEKPPDHAERHGKSRLLAARV